MISMILKMTMIRMLFPNAIQRTGRFVLAIDSYSFLEYCLLLQFKLVNFLDTLFMYFKC
jgi:hypothetical protein